MTWIGLTSENEFYSAHYLSEIFTNDVRGVLETWAAKEAEAKDLAKGAGEREPAWRTPWSRLSSLSRDAIQSLDGIRRLQTPQSRLKAGRKLTRQLLEIFDLPYSPQRICLQERVDSPDLPLLGELRSPQGDPLLWVLEATSLEDGQDFDADPLGMLIHPAQLNSIQDLPIPKSMLREDAPDWQKLLANAVFTQAVPPRWVLLVNPFQWLLLDRAKFAQHRLLRFDWVELFSRREADTLKAVSVLLHRESLLDAQGLSLLDRLEENAHKHAYGVSEDLKYALRECIELLGDYAATKLVEQARAKKEGIFSGENALDPKQLSMECLRYIYRLLFLFYIEARPELGYAPVGSEVYLKGYSLECLRDLELMPLTLESERNGHFLNDSLQCLFRLVAEGTEEHGTLSLGGDQSGRDAFEMRPLRCHLFDLQRTELLNKVVFPNEILQRVIQLMSLSKPARGRQRRGRISYAQLGINQLGAVYEALLSYQGFFAQEDLFEVKKADANYDELEMGFFVNAQALNAYTEAEKVFEKNEWGERRLKKHIKGSFIYRLAGRDREKSASYYTPEVLTRSLVKYALKELVKEQLDPLADAQAKAEKILHLRICEPAMGSAAFLNEAVSQLADLYLELMQRAKDERLAQNDYAKQKQRVKMYLADNCVFGVDLNPVAVELAEVSLWLNALSADRFVPWFGLQLQCGNSLIGARRQVYDKDALRARKRGEDPNSVWLKHAPKKIPLDEPRVTGQIWHFLLPDLGMAVYTDSEVCNLYPEQILAINRWRATFTQPFTPDEILRLETLSAKVEELWQEHTRALAKLRERTTDPYPIYGREAYGNATALSFKDQVENQELKAEGVTNASAYRRLKLLMDTWCALWFWPIERFEDLPDRETWFFDLENLLLGDSTTSLRVGEAPRLFPETQDKGQAQRFLDRFGVVDLEKLLKTSARFQIAEELAQNRRFFHWELAFADVFRDNCGFDLALGNPPWLAVMQSWKNEIIDYAPHTFIKDYSADRVVVELSRVFSSNIAKKNLIDEYIGNTSSQSYLSSHAIYPIVCGYKSDLYKNFIEIGLGILGQHGVMGMLHQNSLFVEEGEYVSREIIFKRMRNHFGFINQKKLFPIGNTREYSFNIYGPPRSEIQFDAIFKLYDPRSIDKCYGNNEFKIGYVTTKDENGNWNENGCCDRIIKIHKPYFDCVKKFFELKRSSNSLLAFRVASELSILQRASHVRNEMSSDLGLLIGEGPAGSAYETGFVDKSNFSLQSTHILMGNIFAQTPNVVCSTHRAYTKIDLMGSSFDYLPRTNYMAGEDIFDDSIPRLFFRRRMDAQGERSLILGVGPKIYCTEGVGYIQYTSSAQAFATAGFMMSIVYDYFVRVSGKPDFRENLFARLPKCLFGQPKSIEIVKRALILSSVNNLYKKLWRKTINALPPENRNWSFLFDNHIVEIILGENLDSVFATALIRSDYARRQLLLELDVISGQYLGISLTDLIAIYSLHFPVMKQYEDDTWYDQSGRIVYTCKKGNQGLPRTAKRSELNEGTSYSISSPGFSESGIALGWEDIKHLNVGTVIKTFQDDTLPDGPIEKTISYKAPFFKPNREDDYGIVWKSFEREGAMA